MLGQSMPEPAATPSPTPEKPTKPSLWSRVPDLLLAPMRRFNTWAAEQWRLATGISTTAWRIQQIELLFLGFTMMQIAEHAAAVACWLILASVWLRTIYRQERHFFGDLGKLVHSVGAIIVCTALIIITGLHKPDNERWSNLQKLWEKKHPPIEIVTPPPAIPEEPKGLHLKPISAGFTDDFKGDNGERLPQTQGAVVGLAFISVRNTGAPTIADNWHVYVQPAGEPYANLVPVMGFKSTLKWITLDGMTIPASKLLYKETLSGPIATGDQRSGVLPFLIKGVTKAQLARRGTRIVITCEDIDQRIIKAPDFIFKGIEDPNWKSQVQALWP